MTDQHFQPPIRIWALLGARAGDNDQVIALAEAIGLPFESKPLDYSAFRRLGPRLLGRSLLSLTAASRQSILGEPPPDLTISTGHRSVAAVRALRHRSGGRTRSIHVGFPRVSPAHFDLVIATPQYPIADHPRLVRLRYALTRAATADADAVELAQLAVLPSPRRLLLIGGPTLYWKLDQAALRQALTAMIGEARTSGSLLVSASPRTPRALRQEIAATLSASAVPSVFAEPGSAPSYASLLASADSVHVTADSVAMASDAIWTGKPVALVPIEQDALGRAAFGLADRLTPDRRLYPQDLRFFWRALAEIGISEQLAQPRVSTGDQMRSLMGRVQPILGAIARARSSH